MIFLRSLRAFCLAGVAVWIAACDAHSPRQELSAILGPRTLEGRLSEVSFAPYQPICRLIPLAAQNTVRRVAQRLAAEAKRRPSAKGLTDLAIFKLLTGSPAEAVPLLERAAASAPRDARLLSDLSAAYIARAGEGDRPFDFVRALSAANRALRLDPGLPEARFNRALSLEKVPLDAEARQAWSEALARESEAGWKVEEQARLRTLGRRAERAAWDRERERMEKAVLLEDDGTVATVVNRFPLPARLYAEEELFAHWSAQMSAGRKLEAERTLSIARAVGSALRRRGGDAMVQDAAAAIDAARAEPSGERLRHLVEGHRLFGIGLNDYRSGSLHRAAPQLERAARELRLGQTPFSDWALLYLASCEYHEAHFDRVCQRLGHLQLDLPRDRYPSLEGQIVWIRGSIDVLRGRPGEALPRFHEARRLFARLGELDRLSGIYYQLALTLGVLGQQEEAWSYLYRGLLDLPRLQVPRSIAGLLDEAGIACLERGYPDEALYFQDRLLDRALSQKNPEMIAATRLRRARTLLRLGRADQTRSELAEALRIAEQISERTPRSRARAEILIARAETALPSDPAAAKRDLNEAIDSLKTADYHLEIPIAYLLRARSSVILGDERLANQDFQSALAEAERVRDSAFDPRLRIAFQDQAGALFDEFLAFLAGRRDAETAFEVSERGRARQLLERLAAASLSGAGIPVKERLLTSEEIRDALPPGTVLVKYAVLENQILVWALGREKEIFRQIPVSRQVVKLSVERARASLLAGGDRNSTTELRELHQLLIHPVQDLIADANEVVFVPDRNLYLLPFAALTDSQTGRYMIENLAVTVAPSANVYVRCLRRYRLVGSRLPETALVVGATEFDRRQFSSFPILPGAGQEAALISATYPRARTFTGAQATSGRFFSELARGPEVVHFAGHAVLNPSFPELSRLLLAPEAGKDRSGVVYSYEIYGLRLDHTRLASLSACDTAVSEEPASEGIVGLARPFLAAGVPAVLASLAPVEDEHSREVLAKFHGRLRAGDSPAEALRGAQLSRLAQGGKAALPLHWAWFEIIGGASSPQP